MKATYKDKNLDIIKRIQNGDTSAKEELILLNRNLVSSVAARMHHAIYSDLSMEDLQQDGYLGLLMAAERFDITSGNSFATFAYFYLVKYMSTANRTQGYRIVYPQYFTQLFSEWTKHKHKCEEDSINSRDTKEYILHHMDITETQYYELSRMYESRNNTTLDAVIPREHEKESSMTLLDTLSSPTDIEDEIIKDIEVNEVREYLNSVIDKKFTPNEKIVLTKKLGFNGFSMTFKDIAQELGFSSQRAQQVYNSAIKKLQSDYVIRNLREIMDYER